MSLYLDTSGNSILGVALCARCSRKFPLDDLYSDPNAPGLMVCEDDLDELDPYRLPARQSENINLPFVRPDESVAIQDVAASAGITADERVSELSDPLLTEDGIPRVVE